MTARSRSIARRSSRSTPWKARWRRSSDDALRDKTTAFRARLAGGEALDDLLPEAFAVVREAAKRTLGQRHFDVQMVGGMVLHEGRIAEMKTGEGKTLVATLPVYLNALAGKGVHVVTVNDYLAKRDADWMGQIYKFLGLTVGCIVHGLSDAERREPICLRRHLRHQQRVRLRLSARQYEISTSRRWSSAATITPSSTKSNSILIDEARTPLIISGAVDDKSDLYNTVDALIPRLVAADYELDEKQRQVTLTENGNEHIEQAAEGRPACCKGDTLYDTENVTIVHHVNQALRAHKLFQRDKDYIVKDDQVIIIDEFTGRMMPGRRYSEGLHQALEAKEHAAIQPENVTLASITFQNYFRLYEKLAGMTGTASTEADEFMDIYKLDVHRDPDQRAGGAQG